MKFGHYQQSLADEQSVLLEKVTKIKKFSSKFSNFKFVHLIISGKNDTIANIPESLHRKHVYSLCDMRSKYSGGDFHGEQKICI